jgi:hypothetical protein
MPSTSPNPGGRMLVTDDSVETIGTHVEVRAEHANAVNATKTNESSGAKPRKGHCEEA